MRFAVAILVLAAGGYLFWLQSVGGPDSAEQKERQTAPVTVVEVSRQSFRDRIPALGTLQAWESIDISSSVSQIIESLNFEDGERVEKGRVLATLRQDAERAALRELRARLDDARREVRRLENLARKNQVAQTELDTAETEVQVLQHQISEVQARIADRTIVAPFSGVLGLREVSEGALVAAGERLTTLDDISRMRLQFTVPARYLAALTPGMAVIARSTAWSDEFVGELTAVGSRVDPVARAITARAVIPNDDGRLRPGLLMELELAGEERDVIMVPEESLQSRAERHFVWVVEGDRAQRTEVSIVDRVPGWVVVGSGVEVGQSIVRDGVVRLSGNEMAVRVVQS